MLSRKRLGICFALAACAWLFIARITGPSDLWDQAQPRTISYTTDIIVHGGMHWLLPIEEGQYPATKPPLYNWLAVLPVKVFGFQSELAHKLPSVMALLACFSIVIILGNRFDSIHGGIGWLAALVLVANYQMFKLGYLARPDMLLVLWLFLAWLCATTVFIGQSSRRTFFVIGFWFFVTLAGLTKGPAALVAVMYAIFAARVIAGSWRSIFLIFPVTGLVACAAIVGLWVYAAWRINPEHVRDVLWYNEIYGRVTGLGPEGNYNGPEGWITDFPNIAFYFLIRFVPWSLFAIAAMVELWRRADPSPSAKRRWHTIEGRTGAWMCGAAIFILVTIGLFTLSAGKRADYIAVCFPQGSLLAAWWLLSGKLQWGRAMPWLAPLIAVIALTSLSIVNRLELKAPYRGYGNELMQFVNDARAAVAEESLEIVYCWTEPVPIQALMGDEKLSLVTDVREKLTKDQPFWVIAGHRPKKKRQFDQWVVVRRPETHVEAVVESPIHREETFRPTGFTLYKVTPKSS